MTFLPSSTIYILTVLFGIVVTIAIPKHNTLFLINYYLYLLQFKNQYYNSTKYDSNKKTSPVNFF